MAVLRYTPDHWPVRPSYQKLGKQQYRAVFKNRSNVPIFTSIAVFRNRDHTTSVSYSALDVARHFIHNELKGEGGTRFRDGEYDHQYIGPAPFYDQLSVT